GLAAGAQAEFGHALVQAGGGGRGIRQDRGRAGRGTHCARGEEAFMRAGAPRLLLVLTELPPAVGGMQTHARHLAAHLSRHAAAIEVLTYRTTDPLLAAQAREFDAACG